MFEIVYDDGGTPDHEYPISSPLRGEPSITSSVFVYTKVLVDNLNDMLIDMLIIVFNPFNLRLKGMK